MKEIDGELVFATPISRIKKMDGELNAFLARVIQSRCATNDLLSIKHKTYQNRNLSISLELEKYFMQENACRSRDKHV